MKTLLKWSALVSSLIFLLYLLLSVASSQDHCSKDDGDHCGTKAGSLYSLSHSVVIHLSVVACGDRLEETLIMIKSATLLSRLPIHVHIFADDDLQPQFKQKLDLWPDFVREKLTYSLYPIQFPGGQDSNEWRKLFKPCASQRLFLPNILSHLDSLLYVDTDILFMRPLDDIWDFLSEFNTTQVAAMAPEHEEPTASWYSRFARHPYVPPYGINSGVMLMNVTRMLEAKWLDHIIPYYKKHQYDITWGDQDLINIFFHYFPEKLFQYTCEWNYRPDHCMYMSNCRSAEEKGVSIVHGNRGVYHNDKQPAFKAIYNAIRDYEFGADLEDGLYKKMAENLNVESRTSCGKLSHLFTKQLSQQITKHMKAKQNSLDNNV